MNNNIFFPLRLSVYVCIYAPWEFFIPAFDDGFHRSLIDSKSPQVSRILLSILTGLCNAVEWMVSARPRISNHSSPFPRLWVQFQSRQQLLSPSLSYFTAFLVFWQGLSTCISFSFLWFSLCSSLGRQNL